MPFSSLHLLTCSRCGAEYDASKLHNLCPADGSPLLARYDLASVRCDPRQIASRPADLWRYHELLPVSSPDAVVSLGEGMTPLLPVPRLGADLGLPRLLVKDEGRLPTGTFKARGAAVALSRARELGARRLAMPTNGNAGAAWSAYAARAGLPAVTVAMPVLAPPITRAEVVATGGDLRLVDGLITDAGRLIGTAVAAAGAEWFEVSTLKEPYRLEGKKTMGLELAEQLGWRMPDVVVYPTGGGVGLLGIVKGLTELLELGWVEGDLPRMVCVQASGCPPIVTAFEAGQNESVPPDDAATVGFGVNVPKSVGDFLVLDALRRTGGTAVAVSDAAMLAEQRTLARLEGLFVCPEGAAAVAAARDLAASGWLSAEDEVILLNTGSGLLYPDLLRPDPQPLGKNQALTLSS